MSTELSRLEIAVCAFAALIVGALGTGAALAFAANGPEMFLARVLSGLAGCF